MSNISIRIELLDDHGAKFRPRQIAHTVVDTSNVEDNEAMGFLIAFARAHPSPEDATHNDAG